MHKRIVRMRLSPYCLVLSFCKVKQHLQSCLWSKMWIWTQCFPQQPCFLIDRLNKGNINLHLKNTTGLLLSNIKKKALENFTVLFDCQFLHVCRLNFVNLPHSDNDSLKQLQKTQPLNTLMLMIVDGSYMNPKNWKQISEAATGGVL